MTRPRSLLLPADSDTVRRSVTELLIALFAALKSSFWARLELEAEILAVPRRQAPRRPGLGCRRTPPGPPAPGSW